MYTEQKIRARRDVNVLQLKILPSLINVSDVHVVQTDTLPPSTSPPLFTKGLTWSSPLSPSL